MLSNPAFVYKSELVLQGQILGAIWYFKTLFGYDFFVVSIFSDLYKIFSLVLILI
jgi:hypothetical protein